MRELALNGQTVRIVARISIGGRRIRVPISNAYGVGDLRVGAASLGRRADGANVVEGTNRLLTFDGGTTTTIRAGAVAVSDPVDLAVESLSDVAVSLYLPDDLPESFGLTGHDPAHQTCYLSPQGDFGSSTELPVRTELASDRAGAGGCATPGPPSGCVPSPGSGDRSRASWMDSTTSASTTGGRPS